MIARLVGTLVDVDGTRGILDVGGVGYEVFATVRALGEWKDQDEPIVVHVSTQVREDAIHLYGFPSSLERRAFLALLQVKGVGPKIGLAILDMLTVEALDQAVSTDDLVTLSKVPGVGKKSAQRLALELKGKLPAGSFAPPQVGRSRPTDDVFALALARLQYTKSEIDRARRGLEEQGMGSETAIGERVRAALKILSG